jgi:hypothetical protein
VPDVTIRRRGSARSWPGRRPGDRGRDRREGPVEHTEALDPVEAEVPETVADSHQAPRVAVAHRKEKPMAASASSVVFSIE